jgi:hypothetical protein
MQRMTRVAGVPALVLLLAACAGPGTGAGGSTSASQAPGSMTPGASVGASGMASMPAASGEAAAGGRVDIGALTADPSTYEGQTVTVLARVDEVVLEDRAFLTSPSASEDGQIAVVIKPDAQVDKAPTAGSVVWVDGTVVGFTAEDLQAAGIDLSPEELGGFNGEFVLVANAIRDPLASDS